MARVFSILFCNDIVFRCIVEALYSNCLSINSFLDVNTSRLCPSVLSVLFPSYCRCLNSNGACVSSVQYKLIRQRIPQNCTRLCLHMSSRDGIGNRLEHLRQPIRVCCSEIVITTFTTLCSFSKGPLPFPREWPCSLPIQSCVRIIGRHCMHVLVFFRGIRSYVFAWICIIKNPDSIDFYSLILKNL